MAHAERAQRLDDEFGNVHAGAGVPFFGAARWEDVGRGG